MAVPSVLTDLSVSEASNSPPDTETVTASTRPSDYLRALGAILRRPFAKGADVASLTAASLGANTDGDYFHITGTTGLAASHFGTVSAGIGRTIVFDGALLLTHNATSFILPGAANITTAAGDVSQWRSEGSGNWKCTSYVRASGAPVGSYQPLDDQLTTLAAITATQATDLAALSTFMGTVLNDTSQGAALTTLGAPLHTHVFGSTNHTVQTTDRGKLFDYTGTYTLALSAAATLGTAFVIAVRNSGTGVITADPFGAELIDGAATATFGPGESGFIVCDGTAWKTVGKTVGKILQVVHFDTGAMATGTTIIPLDDTIPQNTEGDEYMSLAITPTSSTSTLQIDVSYMATNTASAWITGAVFRDTTAGSIGVATEFTNAATGGGTTSLSVKAASGSTAATTFKVRIGASVAGTTTLNGQSGGRLFGGVMSSSIRITEISA